MSWTFARLAGLAGLVGSIVLAGMLLVPVLNLDNDTLGAPLYGASTLLLAVFAVGLYRAGNGRLNIAAKAGLVGAIAGLLGIATIAVMDIFSAGYDWLWYVFLASIALAFAGFAVYGAGATIARAIPAWIGIPLAAGGAVFVAIEVLFVVMGDRITRSADQALNVAGIVAVTLVLAGCGLLGVMLALERIPGPAAPARSLTRTSTGLAFMVAVVVAALLLAGMAGMTNPTTAQESPASLPAPSGMVRQGSGRPIVVDTDMAPEDATAVLYLLQRDDVSVKAITVVGTGEAHCEPGVRNARGLLTLAGHVQVPVACGRDNPYDGGHSFPDEWRKGADALQGVALPESTGTDPGMSAPQLIEQLAEMYSGELSVLALGPLTNLADALQSDHDLASKLHAVYVMGGAVEVPGNVAAAPAAEWNIYADPHAASAVFASDMPLTLVPLDATNFVPVDTAYVNRLEAEKSTPQAEFAYRLLKASEGLIAEGDYCFWDTFSAALMTDNSLGTFREIPLQVVEDGLDSGRTALNPGGKAIRVAVSADPVRFKQILLDTLNGRER
jgi:pyrimidine-specific ribonucleoside hydrolase